MNVSTLVKTLSLGAVALALSVGVAKAGPISGSIDFYATTPPKTDTGNLSTATAFTSITGTYVQVGATGSYAGLDGDAVTFKTPLVFSQTGSNLLWTIATGSGTYTFDETSIVVHHGMIDGVKFLNIAGTGVAYWDGTDASSGTWSITDTTTGGAGFTFSASTTVPDSGTTALLIALGLGAIGAGLFVQKRGGRFA